MENRMSHHGSGRDGEKTIVDVDFETFSCRVIAGHRLSFLDAPTGENRRENVHESGIVLTPYKQDYKKVPNGGCDVTYFIHSNVRVQFTWFEIFASEPAGPFFVQCRTKKHKASAHTTQKQNENTYIHHLFLFSMPQDCYQPSNNQAPWLNGKG